jgi:hypothetical protein
MRKRVDLPDGVVYIVEHVHDLRDGSADVKLIGVYATRTEGLAAVKRLGKQPGFRELPRSFHVCGYEVGKDHWTEGFVTVGRRR